jgi:hypothetical protein
MSKAARGDLLMLAKILLAISSTHGIKVHVKKSKSVRAETHFQILQTHFTEL